MARIYKHIYLPCSHLSTCTIRDLQVIFSVAAFQLLKRIYDKWSLVCNLLYFFYAYYRINKKRRQI